MESQIRHIDIHETFFREMEDLLAKGNKELEKPLSVQALMDIESQWAIGFQQILQRITVIFGKIVKNEDEIEKIRESFSTYLRATSLSSMQQELGQRIKGIFADLFLQKERLIRAKLDLDRQIARTPQRAIDALESIGFDEFDEFL